MLAAAWAMGCPYYNTFYNAKKAFHEAERIRREGQTKGGPIPEPARQLYDRAIANAGLIIRDHPQSDLVDDALVLIGDIFQIQSDYAKAARKYEEVLTNYPESDWSPYCMFALGSASLSAGDTTQAEASLLTFLQNHPRSTWSPDAYMLLGAIALARQDYALAVERYTEFLTGYPKHDRRAEAEYAVAAAYLELDRYEEALPLFERVGKNARTPELEFQAHFMTGECLRRDDQYEAARKTFEGLLKKDAYEKYRPKLMLALAACQRSLRQDEEAIRQYELINTRYERERDYTPEVAQALFELGTIYEQRGELKKAEEFFGMAEKRSPQAFWVRQRAAEKSEDLHQFQKFRDALAAALAALAPGDSAQPEAALDAKLREQVIAARFQLAEHYLFRLNMADSALVHYRLIEQETDYPSIAAKAAYARAWIMEHVIGDTASSRRGYEALLEDYAQTIYASEAAQALAVPDPSGPSVEALLHRAETCLFTEQQPDSAVWYYQQIVERYPETEYAPQALLALGWITETYSAHPDSALEVYKRLKEAYPGTEQAKQADLKIRYAREWRSENGSVPASDTPDSLADSLPAFEAAAQEPSADASVSPEGLILDRITKADLQGTVAAIAQGEIVVRLAEGQQVAEGAAGYVYTVETEDSLDVARRVADIQVSRVDSALVEQVTTGANLDIRETPNGRPLSMLPPHVAVEMMEDQGEWAKIRYEGLEGYVLKEYLIQETVPVDQATCRILTAYRPLTEDLWLGVRFDGVQRR
jgi:TolA-binding protein